LESEIGSSWRRKNRKSRRARTKVKGRKLDKAKKRGSGFLPGLEKNEGEVFVFASLY